VFVVHRLDCMFYVIPLHIRHFCIQNKKNWKINEGNLGSISPTFYKLLLYEKIPKNAKSQSNHQFFALLGSKHIKASRKNVDEINPCISYISKK